MKADIVIIGGGIVGSSIAYHLVRDGRAGSVVVIEPDPTYELAATPRGAGGVRRLFSRPENIRLSQYSLAFFEGFAETMAVDDVAADIGFRRHGYLFVVGESGATQLEENHRLQRSLGVPADLLDRAALARRFPSVGVEDVALAVHSPQDAWIDPESAARGFARKARRLGARYLQDKVVGLESAGGRVRRVRLEAGATIEGSAFVNAAGAWAAGIAAMAGMALPIDPMPRQQHYVLVRAEIEPLPLIKDETGLFLRPEGEGFVCGRPRWDIDPGFDFATDDAYFESVVRPLLATRVPALETLKLARSWVGHYAENTLDGNMIVGPWTGGMENLYVASGFSGHGTMHAPAIGLAMSELLLDGAYVTIDLTRLGYRRVLNNEPYPEMGIV